METEKQLTAVEWFNQQLVDRQNGNGDSRSRDEIFEQAKEMEKEQIMNAWNDGQSDGATICTQKADNPSKEYYNKTFKSK